MLGLVGFAALAMIADAVFELHAAIRRTFLAAWVAAGLVLAFGGLVRPVMRRMDWESLAAAVEARYPELGERLTSTVELAASPDAFHGSPTFVRLLARETEARTRRLNFAQAFPARATGWLAGTAALALLLFGLPALLRPGPYAELGRRFLFPWQTPALFDLDVTPGNAFVARGRPLTLAVVVRPRRENVPPPENCTLVLTDGSGQTGRRLMSADRADAFSLRVDPVVGDFKYRVEAGGSASGEYRVTAVEPLQLLNEKSAIRVTPPEYARTAVQLQEIHGLADFMALEHSQLDFALQFTRPAAAASLKWTSAGHEKGRPASRTLPLTLSSDGYSGALRLPAVADGTYKLVLEAEHGIVTELPPQAVTVRKDQPPAFVQVSGGDGLRVVRPDETVPLAVEVADDLGVEAAEVEYRVNDGPPAVEPIPLQGQGTRSARGELSFRLSGKVKEGDRLHYRFRAADNRRVPEAGLAPNVVYHPPETAPGKARWRTLQIARQAGPLKEQEIAAQNDEVKRQLEALRGKLRDERNDLQQLRKETQDVPDLKPEQAKQLAALREKNQALARELRELARDAAATPALKAVAVRAQEASDREISRSGEALARAEKEKWPEPRRRQLDAAAAELAAADGKLEELQRHNDRLTQIRLDQMKLEDLAVRQQQLADRAGAEAANGPVKDPRGGASVRDLQRQQDELANELQRRQEESEGLRQALDAARAEKATRLAERARELAQAERDLSEKKPAAAEGSPGKQPADAPRQQELSQETGDLVQDLKRLADGMQRFPQAQAMTGQAAASGHQAQEAMRQAQKADRPLEAEQARQRAAAALDQAARQADLAAKQMAPTKPEAAPNTPMDPSAAAPAGRDLEKAQEQMRRAQGQLADGQADGARQAMQQAARALQQAAQQLTQTPRRPDAGTGQLGASPGGRPDQSPLTPELQKYAGKPWGELPGELRTKVLMEARERYGDDYARIIKLYFEQIADKE